MQVITSKLKNVHRKIKLIKPRSKINLFYIRRNDIDNSEEDALLECEIKTKLRLRFLLLEYILNPDSNNLE